MIEVKNLTYTYTGNKEETIRGLDFSIAQGEIFGFLGPSGAGKSTTQKILIGILKSFQGEFKILGKSIKEFGRELYEQIGVAFEFPNLYERFSAKENLDYFRSFYQGQTRQPEELLEMVGLDNEGKKRVDSYSKGMKMRLNFCRSLLADPEILFLDEPTSGLDPANGANIKKIIMDQKKQGKTIFLTTHNMTVAEDLCDRVAFLVDGKIALIDTPRDLRVKHGKKAIQVEYRANNHLEKKDFMLKGLGSNKDFIQLLNNHDVERIVSLEPTLEDIFIKTTGRALV
jgi:fluoroquinolone transport system ATP-binding protein